MAQRRFPEITPTGRSYTPGSQPVTIFRAQNGAVNRIEFGGKFCESELQLQFQNISDSQAQEILQHYKSVVGDDYITFKNQNGLNGMSQGLRDEMERGGSEQLLKYRYKEPPQITSVYPGISSVSCSFVGSLRGV